MAFSSYVLMLHVRFITHAHQLFLQVAVEQGLIAFLAFAGMVIVSLWALLRSPAASRSGPFPAVAALAALVALAVHGMTDAGIYVSRIAPVIFLPFGFAVAAWGTPVARRPGRGPTRPGLWLAIGLACVVLLLMVLPSARAAWQANLGAVAQTRAELSVYDWPEWPIQDAVRRANPAILEPALRRYDAALELDPQNVTANRRLGQIELSLGRYAEAERHIAAAYTAAPGDRAGRQLLGEIKAISGATEEAAALWHSVNLAQRQPDSRQWWYNDIGEPEKAALIERAARQAGW
jgi:tetratricopeptide (TPR) repeat protein